MVAFYFGVQSDQPVIIGSSLGIFVLMNGEVVPLDPIIVPTVDLGKPCIDDLDDIEIYFYHYAVERLE